MYDEVLLPTDGSSETVDVIDHALGVATGDATVHSLYVVDRRHVMAAAEESKDEVRRSLEERGERALEDVRVHVADAGLSCETTCAEGIPHRTIVEYATENDVDLVVMGTHGQTGPERIAAMGSTTERVLQNGSAPPVLVVNLG
jgi:nucleotide-binding universal stress UspA family protein